MKNTAKKQMKYEEFARQMYIISNSFYGNFGAELFNNVNKRQKQENFPFKSLKINEIYKKK
jgi:predicted secreted acid phosphatase